jgi:hypothetical protein
LSVLQLASFYSLYKLVQALTSPEKNSVESLMNCTEKNWITEKQNAGREAGTSMKRGESHIKKEKRGDTLRSYAMPPQRVRRPA